MGGELSAGGATVFVGFMGAGKTTAAKALASARGTRAVDIDAVIEERAGMTVREIFERDGEPAFRALEESVVSELLANAQRGEVISLSGGAVGSARVRAALAPHVVIWLDIEPQVAWRRAATGRRPLAQERASFEALHHARLPLYASVADAFVPALAKQSALRAFAAAERLREAPPGVRLIWAASASGDYPVWVGRGALGAELWPIARPPSRRFVVSDASVAALWLAKLAGGYDGEIQIAAGEASKTLANAETVWRRLASDGMTRSDHLVALGGGVVGDLAGFCAATYQRGVPIVQIPTTLVAQVDSAFGGKTGVDIAAAKNYVGAYHQPAGVIVDPGTLATLPAAELHAGYAEVLKTALIAGGSLWERISSGADVDEQVIVDCIRCKLAVVGADERDGGLRQVLNLGHTVGHAIETATGYGRYRHGEAVAIGLLAALRLSGDEKLHDDVAALLAANSLPTSAPGVDVDAVLAALARDKKRGPDGVPMVLVERPGEVRHGVYIDSGEIERVVRELCR
jgi:shikimate kinase/3-dehydroquinate synthase